MTGALCIVWTPTLAVREFDEETATGPPFRIADYDPVDLTALGPLVFQCSALLGDGSPLQLRAVKGRLCRDLSLYFTGGGAMVVSDLVDAARTALAERAAAT